MPKPSPLIGFTGRKQAGKSTAAKILVRRFGYERISFAAPIKAMTEQILIAAGYVGPTGSDVRDAMLWGDKKEEVLPEIGCTPRHLMQTLGTEWGRALIRDDLWIRLAMQRAERLREESPVVIDDLRFPNEAEAVRAAGGLVVKLYRMRGEGSCAHMDTHASEQKQAEIEPDFTLANTTSLEALEKRVLDFAFRLHVERGWEGNAPRIHH